jgi:hypothetical protein
MSDIHKLNDVSWLDPAELAGVEGGFFVADGYCGTPVPRVPIPTNPAPVVTAPAANVTQIIAILIG